MYAYLFKISLVVVLVKNVIIGRINFMLQAPVNSIVYKAGCYPILIGSDFRQSGIIVKNAPGAGISGMSDGRSPTPAVVGKRITLPVHIGHAARLTRGIIIVEISGVYQGLDRSKRRVRLGGELGWLVY